jgi:AraC family transcriptional regulator of arabinose operon
MIVRGGHNTFSTGHSSGGTFDAWTVHYTLRGNVVMRHPDGDLACGPDQVILVEPRRVISWYAPPKAKGAVTPPWEVVWLHYQATPEAAPLFAYPRDRQGYSVIPIHHELHRTRMVECLCRALELFQSSLYGSAGLAECALREAMLWCRVDQRMAVNPLHPVIEEALRVIDQHLAMPLTSVELARRCGVSRSKLLALFTREMGVPFRVHCERQRMRHAQQLLQSGHLTVKQIAAELGYADPKYFTRRFKRTAGSLPSGWKPRRGGAAKCGRGFLTPAPPSRGRH